MSMVASVSALIQLVISFHGSSPFYDKHDVGQAWAFSAAHSLLFIGAVINYILYSLDTDKHSHEAFFAGG